MASIFSNNNYAFGLDISGSSFKTFQFSGPPNDLKIGSYSDIALPKGMVNNDAITDQAVFIRLLKANLQKPQFGALRGKYVVVSLPESKSFVRVIQIPRMTDIEAENAVPFEAESFIPLPIDQVYLDWQKLDETADKMNVLIIASPRDFVDKYLVLLDEAGLIPVALEVQSQSCQRALIPRTGKPTSLIVDLGVNRSSLIMVESGNLQFTSTIPFAGNAFTESIAKSLGVSGAKADLIKQKIGIANTTEYPNIKTALLPVLNNMVSEIKNILKFHADHSEHQVESIVLTGGTAKMKNLIEFLEPQFRDFPGLAVRLGNPWENVPHVQGNKFEAIDVLNFTTAIGLALRGVNYEDN